MTIARKRGTARALKYHQSLHVVHRSARLISGYIHENRLILFYALSENPLGHWVLSKMNWKYRVMCSCITCWDSWRCEVSHTLHAGKPNIHTLNYNSFNNSETWEKVAKLVTSSEVLPIVSYNRAEFIARELMTECRALTSSETEIRMRTERLPAHQKDSIWQQSITLKLLFCVLWDDFSRARDTDGWKRTANISRSRWMRATAVKSVSNRPRNPYPPGSPAKGIRSGKWWIFMCS